MSQVYNNPNQSSQLVFDAQPMFINKRKKLNKRDTAYNDVLNLLRNVFKQINYKDLLM